MIKDPLTEWEEGFPYDLLAPAGITPDSSRQEIMDASFTLMGQRAMTPQVRKAWDTLRQSERRLVVQDGGNFQATRSSASGHAFPSGSLGTRKPIYSRSQAPAWECIHRSSASSVGGLEISAILQ